MLHILHLQMLPRESTNMNPQSLFPTSHQYSCTPSQSSHPSQSSPALRPVKPSRFRPHVVSGMMARFLPPFSSPPACWPLFFTPLPTHFIRISHDYLNNCSTSHSSSHLFFFLLFFQSQ
ncbi:MAG: hypothetical protein FE78DRAFT_368089 [Acidomyces sp. 'richmondensis']|nr:MAG: hypothetical protein FE78DRAFT_368089 [Acidomyces sp. 'richmondensis']